jgi:hypothetical protein
MGAMVRFGIKSLMAVTVLTAAGALLWREFYEPRWGWLIGTTVYAFSFAAWVAYRTATDGRHR